MATHTDAGAVRRLADKQEIADLCVRSYTDTLTRTAGGWRIIERVQACIWRDGNRAVVAR